MIFQDNIVSKDTAHHDRGSSAPRTTGIETPRLSTPRTKKCYVEDKIKVKAYPYYTEYTLTGRIEDGNIKKNILRNV